MPRPGYPRKHGSISSWGNTGIIRATFTATFSQYYGCSDLFKKLAHLLSRLGVRQEIFYE
jgi:hypothetical protein